MHFQIIYFLSINAIPTFSYFTIEFVFDSAAESVPARVGGKIALRCPIVKAVPPPVIVWRFGDGTLVPAVNAEGGDLAASRYQLLPSGHLVIVNITQADIEASFYCEVTNALIHNTNRSSSIAILQSSKLFDSLHSTMIEMCTV